MKTIRAALAGGMLVFLAACGGGGNEDAAAPSGPATLGAEGGTVTGADGVSLTVPPGSLSEPRTLRIARDTTDLSAALQGGTPAPDKAVVLSPTYAMTPHGTVFARPVELRIPIDTAAANGPGLIVVLRTDPGRDGWDVMPIKKIENGAAVVDISTFSFYKVIKITGMVVTPGTLVPLPPVLEMSMTLGGAAPSDFIRVDANGTPQSTVSERRLYGSIANRTDTLRVSGRIVGLPATCTRISLAGHVTPTQNPTAADASFTPWGVGRNNLGEPVFAELTATVGSDTTGGVTRPTLSFVHDINIDNAPFKVELFHALRASNTTGPTPPIGLTFNAYAQCGNDVDLGGGLFLHNWMVVPGATVYDGGFPGNTQLFLDPHGWRWNTILFTTDYLPQGIATPPQDVTVGAGMPASFTTSVWSAPEGESRIEWWRSDNEGVTWSRVRTTIVPITLTADTYTLPAAAMSDNNALIRVRHCGIPRTATPDESCTDSPPARLTVLQGMSAASFSQQPRPVLVRTGQTASFSVAVGGSPAPSVRWQWRAANSSGAWADVSSGSGAATLNYTTTPLTAPDNGLQVRAVASNLVGEVASVPVTASVSDIDVPPTIASQPAALSVVAGSEAVFAVVARGTEALSYQWRRNGVAINGANAPVLKLAQVTPADATGYSVLVSNPAGSVASDAAVLTVSDGPVQAVAPSIVTQPVAVVVNAGNTATFAVGVSGSGPLSYQWLRDGNPIAGATSAFHSIAQAAPGDAGAYSVRVSNSVGPVTSTAATLTVNAGAAGSPPAISTPPATLVVAPGGAATLAVAASGSGPLAYQWLHDGAVVVGQTGAVYHFTSVSALDAGAYQVRVSNALGEVTSAPAQILVVGAPAWTLQPANASVTVGGSASFSVAASGDALRYQWTRNAVALPGATGTSYTTPALTLADNGAVYAVIAYNAAGLAISNGAVLTVAPAPVAKAWQAAALIEVDNIGNAESVQVAVNASGQAVAVWQQPDSMSINIWAARYSPTSGWADPEPIDLDPETAQQPQVAIDPQGNAIVVWIRSDGFRNNVWARRYIASFGWGSPVLIENGLGDAGNPQIAMDGNGNAIVVFWQHQGGRTDIVANRFLNGDGWGTAVAIESDDTGDASAPQIAMDAAGNAMVAWAWASASGPPYSFNVWANRYTTGSGWGNAGPIDVANASTANPNPHVALDGAGNAIAVWHRPDGSWDSIWSNRYAAGSGWNEPTLIETDNTNSAREARVAFDTNGNAMAVWIQSDGVRNNVLANRYTSGAGWGSAVLIETNNAGPALEARIAFDASGNATAVWSHRDVAGFTFNILANRWTAATGWGTAAPIDNAPAEARAPQLGVDGSGNVIAVWSQSDGTRTNIWANAFR